MLAACATVIGCAPPPVFVRPNTTMAEFDRDISQCQYEAASSTANYGSGQNTARTLGGAIAQGIGTGLGRSLESTNLVLLCMRARGYTRGGPSIGGYPALASETIPMEGKQLFPPPITPVVAPPPGATPQIAVSLKVESKYQFTAEGIAKAQGCIPPMAAMTSKGAGMEMFAIACPNGTTLAIRCEVDGCRVLR